MTPDPCLLCGHPHPAFRGLFVPAAAWLARHDPRPGDRDSYPYAICTGCTRGGDAIGAVGREIAAGLDDEDPDRWLEIA